MYYSNLPLSRRLFFYDKALTIAETDAIIAEAITVFGFTPERLAEGRSVYSATYEAYNRKKDLFAVQVETTDRLKTLERVFRVQFKSDRQIVRGIVGTKRADREPFGLNEAMGRSRGILVDQAARFYDALKENANIMTVLQDRFMIEAALLDGRLAELAVLVDAIKDHQVKKAEAQVATQRRGEAVAQLDVWMGSFLTMARRAFREDKKQLEKLGLKVVLNPNRTEEEEEATSEADATSATSTTSEAVATSGTGSPFGAATPSAVGTPSGASATPETGTASEAGTTQGASQ